MAQPVQASGYGFQIGYSVNLSGINFGKAYLIGSIKNGRYRIDGGGKLTGVAGIVFEFSATAAAEGFLTSVRPDPSAFSVNASDGKRSATVRMTMANHRGRVSVPQSSAAAAQVPPSQADPGHRCPQAPDHRSPERPAGDRRLEERQP